MESVIVFDMDGVLVDVTESYRATIIETVRHYTGVTIEPGLYFIDLLLDEAQRNGLGRYVHWDTVRDLKPYGGIRVEDDVACTSTSTPENLTRDAFAAVA